MKINRPLLKQYNGLKKFGRSLKSEKIVMVILNELYAKQDKIK